MTIGGAGPTNPYGPNRLGHDPNESQMNKMDHHWKKIKKATTALQKAYAAWAKDPTSATAKKAFFTAVTNMGTACTKLIGNLNYDLEHGKTMRIYMEAIPAMIKDLDYLDALSSRISPDMTFEGVEHSGYLDHIVDTSKAMQNEEYHWDGHGHYISIPDDQKIPPSPLPMDVYVELENYLGGFNKQLDSFNALVQQFQKAGGFVNDSAGYDTWFKAIQSCAKDFNSFIQTNGVMMFNLGSKYPALGQVQESIAQVESTLDGILQSGKKISPSSMQGDSDLINGSWEDFQDAANQFISSG